MTGDFPDEWFRPAPGAGDAKSSADAETSDTYAAYRRPAPGHEEASRPRTPVAPHAATPVPPPTTPSTLQPPAPPAATSHQVGSLRERPPRPSERARGGRAVRLLLGTAVTLALAGAVGGAGLRMLRQDTTETATATSGMQTPSAGASQQPLSAWTGPTRTVRPQSVAASCTAPDQQGYNGELVPSAAERVLDEDTTTGWRCDGDSVGETLTFTFAPGTRIVGVRVVNGYTKITNGKDLYPQYRRATDLQWSFPGQGSAWFVQALDAGTAAGQETRIPEISTDGTVRLTVKATTEPGLDDASRDALVLTEVTFLAKA